MEHDTVNAATLRNMTLDELTQYVDQCDSVPRDVVHRIIHQLKEDKEDAVAELDGDYSLQKDRLTGAINEIHEIVAKPLESADLYQKALKVWIEDWGNDDE